MAEAVVAPIVEDIWKRLVAATSQQFGYLIHYNRNIRNLNEQVEKLESLINDNRRFIQAAKNNNEEIRDVVQDWMARAGGIVLEAKNIVDDANANKMCFFGWCPDLISCYRLSRKANKKVNTVTQLEEGGKFQDVSIPASTPGIETFLPSEDFVDFETTRLAMEKVMEALKEDKINFIGIHGMGGAGKTTMVKEIAKKAEKDKLFDKVVFAVVSQTVELEKIQDQLADQLDLEFKKRSELGRAGQLRERLKSENRILVILDDVWDRLKVTDILEFKKRSELGRAGQLRERLKSENRILVILDDVWDRLKVTDICIPMGVDHQGCKLIITTRREQVCRTMGMGSETSKIIHLGVLSKQESWALFRTKVGDFIDSSTLMAVAQKVAAECGGLPIALVTVGRAMRDVKDEKEWKRAANVLKKSMPTQIEGVEQDVYKCLKFSYDYLRDEEAKACFLLCSLFPEDHNISIEDLARYGMGLGIFENVETVNEARDRTDSIINNLKSSCLLMLAGNREGNVKMHDVVRDVAISIGSKMYLVRAGKNVKEWPNLETLKNYIGISLMNNVITVHPDALECPKLQILLLQSDHPQQIPGVFKGMEALKVFDGSIVRYRNGLNYGEFEPSFRYLTNIRTLILEGWEFGDITALGEIKTLEILSFARCTFQEPLNALRHLTNLRLLDLRFCQIARGTMISSIVPQDVISRLSRLEELYMEGASASWASEGSNENLPRIVELRSLPHLTILTMHIDGLECIPENFVFPDLEIFRITIGPDDENPRRNNYFFDESVKRFENYLTINGGGRQQKELLPIRSLNFVGHSLNILKTLEVRGCDELEYLSQRLGFDDLEKLSLLGLKNFLGIYDGVLPHDLSLMKLKILKVDSCPKLSNIFPRPGSPQRLKELEKLKVKDCEAMEHIFDLEFEGPIAEEKELLASLRELELERLYELKHIWKGPTENIILHNLQKVKIRDCVELKNLFLPAMARTLKKLEALEVFGCTKLEEIIAKEQEGQEEEEAAANRIVFPQLKTLHLWHLSNLNGFCIGSFTFEWPSLESLMVNECPKMKTFTAAVPADGIQSTPKLNTMFLDGVKIDVVDINSAIQKHFKGKELYIKELLENKDFQANLKVLRLEGYHELKHLWKGPTAQVILHNLQEVRISKCYKLKSLFLPTIARTLEKLEYLQVSYCGELEDIVAKEQEGHEEEEAAIHKIVFPQLKTLLLYGLPNLNGFCIGSFPFEWPSLELVMVMRCPKMKTFTAAVPADGIQSTPKLNTIKLDDVEIDGVDINSAIQKHFKEKPLLKKADSSSTVKFPLLKISLRRGNTSPLFVAPTEVLHV